MDVDGKFLYPNISHFFNKIGGLSTAIIDNENHSSITI